MNKIYQDEKWYIGDGKGHNIEEDGTSLNEREALNFIDASLTDFASDDEIRIKSHLLDSSEMNEIILNPPASEKPVDSLNVPVGFIINFFGDVAPMGYLLCDGSEYNKADYADLYAHLSSLGTAASYEGTTNDTFKVPDLMNRFLKGAATSGTYEQAGLPNITGAFNHEWGSYATNYASSLGAFRASLTSLSGGMIDAGGGSDGQLGFDASRYNAIYGRSNTVTPENLSILYCIKY